MPRFSRTPTLAVRIAPLLRITLPALAGLLLASAPALADEGMWTYDNFPKTAVKERYGVEITDAWLKHVMLSSVRIPGCSGSFVTGSGLLMTNYHCADSCVQDHSTKEKDYAASGFRARSNAEEIACPGMDVSELVGIEDVTAGINAVTKGLSGGDFIKAQRSEMSRIEKACSEEGKTRCDVVTLYHGGLYHLYKYRTYSDLRLVFVPEHDVAFFGGDPDNFNFPRYNLDVAFFRAYEGGKPATTPDHLTWSPAGTKDGDPIFAPGNPGGTDRLLTVSQLEYQRDVAYPAILMRLSEYRGRLIQFGRIGEEEWRISKDPLLFVENGIKVNRGEFEALLDRRRFDEKVKAENELRARIAADPAKQAKYGAAWDEIAKAQVARRNLRKPFAYIAGTSGFSSELFSDARTLVRGAAERPKPSGERLREFRDSALPRIEQRLLAPSPVHRNLEQLRLEFSLSKLREEMGADDPFVKRILGKESPESLARLLLAGSKLDDPAVRKALWEGGQKAIDTSDDSMIRLAREIDPEAREIRKRFEDEADAPERKNSELVAQALFEDQGTNTYPDATFTPRLTYGVVKGWEEDGRPVPAFTQVQGLFDRATGKDPYALPQSWLDARPKLRMDGPMNFVCDLDIVGGSSGSPAIDREARIVGILFDGNIQSIGGNFWFNDSVNRAVAVDGRLILEALRTVYGAGSLVDELTGK